MYGFYCIAFIEYMLAEKTLLDYTNLLCPNDYKKNYKIIYKYFKDKYVRRSKSTLEFRLRKIYKIRNYLLDEIKHNDLMSEKYKKTCKYLNYVEHLLILASTVTSCVSISASLVCVPVGITSSVAGIKICEIIVGVKKYKSITKKKKKKKHSKIVLLGKDKLNTTEVLISKTLIDSYISHDEFVSVNNVLGEYYEMKEETKNSETSVEYIT